MKWVNDGFCLTISSNTADRCGSRPLTLRDRAQRQAVAARHDPRIALVGPLEVVHQQPPVRPQQLLDQHDRQTVDVPILRAIQVAEVVHRLAVAQPVAGRLDLLLEPPVVRAVGADDRDPVGDAGAVEDLLGGGIPRRTAVVDGGQRAKAVGLERRADIGGRHAVRCSELERALRAGLTDVVVHAAPELGRHERNSGDRGRDLVELHPRILARAQPRDCSWKGPIVGWDRV